MVLPMSVDELYTLLFVNPVFYADYLTKTLKGIGIDNVIDLWLLTLFVEVFVEVEFSVQPFWSWRLIEI